MKNTILMITLLMAAVAAKAQPISPDFPFPSKYLEVEGSKMHYVEEYADASKPDRPTFLFLHGNPTSSYLWRNVIPYVKDHGAAVAVDLIGMGKSDKPDIDYTYQDHYRYLEGFIQKKGLRNIVLVIHDWGSGLGFHYARQNEENVRGIVFMEAITRTIDWKEATLMERFLFKRFRHERKGHKMIAENNFFIKKFLFKFGTGRKLSKAEKAYYAAPYPTVESRKPVRVWPKEIPIEGTPQRNFDVVSGYAEWLKETELPKLLLYAKPGMIIKKSEVERLQVELKNLEAVYVGKGKHYIQEDHPHEIGRAIEEWAGKVDFATPSNLRP